MLGGIKDFMPMVGKGEALSRGGSSEMSDGGGRCRGRHRVENRTMELRVRQPRGHRGPLQARRLVWPSSGILINDLPDPGRTPLWPSKNCCFSFFCSFSWGQEGRDLWTGQAPL